MFFLLFCFFLKPPCDLFNTLSGYDFYYSCTCNNGFSAPNCVATCPGNATLAASCSGHGWCSSPPSNCVCDAGWTKADCSTPAMLATPCTDDSNCDTRACFKVNANDTTGICCATPCNRECNTCAGIGAAQVTCCRVDVEKKNCQNSLNSYKIPFFFAGDARLLPAARWSALR